jgi:hypothetical protein
MIGTIRLGGRLNTGNKEPYCLRGAVKRGATNCRGSFHTLFHSHGVDLPSFQFMQVAGKKAGHKTRKANGF